METVRSESGLICYVQENSNLFRLDKSYDLIINSRKDINREIIAPTKELREIILKRENIESLNIWRETGFLMSEIGSNAEKGGNKFDPNKHTWLEYAFNKSPEGIEFELIVTDEGKGCPYNHIMECARKTRDSNFVESYNAFRDCVPKFSHGYGLFAVISAVDSIEWNKKGNEITITMFFPDA